MCRLSHVYPSNGLCVILRLKRRKKLPSKPWLSFGLSVGLKLICIGSIIFRIGVLAGNCGGGIVFPFGIIRRMVLFMFLWMGLKIPKIGSKIQMFWIPGFRHGCGL